MKKKIYIVLISISIIGFFSCNQDTKNKKLVTQDIQFTKEGELTLYTLQDSTVVKITTLNIEIADNDYERETGLMYRKSMDNNNGMLFISEEYKPQHFYMKNTLLPLDIIYIDDHYKIVSFQKNAKPQDETSLPSKKPAKYILEINAGLSDQWLLKTGDSISFKSI